jgi:hypothetical protein
VRKTKAENRKKANPNRALVDQRIQPRFHLSPAIENVLDEPRQAAIKVRTFEPFKGDFAAW